MLEKLFYSNWLLQLTFAGFGVSLIGYIAAFILTKKISTKPFIMFMLTTFLLIVAFALDTWLIVDHWIKTGRPPFKSMYEATIFITWAIALIYIVVELTYKVRILGLITTLGIIGIFFYALTKRDVEAPAMMPALQSPLFVPHVTSYVLGYGGFAIAFISAILYLAFPNGISGYWVMSSEKTINFSKYTYNIAKFGFLLLTLGLLLGAWWGHEAWSNYWGWDPKENWALVSWFAFIGYFHLKYIKSWDEKKLSYIVIIGFLIIVFTYLGMKYIPGLSLHKYNY